MGRGYLIYLRSWKSWHLKTGVMSEQFPATSGESDLGSPGSVTPGSVHVKTHQSKVTEMTTLNLLTINVHRIVT